MMNIDAKIIMLMVMVIIINKFSANAQHTDSLSGSIKISAYIETYYSRIDGDKTDEYPGFIYSHDRNNQINLNLGILKASFNNESVRANIGLMTGTYTNANLRSEPDILQNIYEANAGIKLSKKYNVWLDAGVMPSHIGFESAIGKDCWTLTRSILADNSPYFETGAKLSYTNPNGKWYFGILGLNGWQRIQSPLSAVGHQITYKPSDKLTINSSSFIGKPSLDEDDNRLFHNFYSIYQATSKTGIILGFDYGIQMIKNGMDGYWLAPICIIKYSLLDNFNISARIEHYNDKDEIIIRTNSKDGFNLMGYSLNIDYKITDAALWRIEFRKVQNKESLFHINGALEKNLSYFTTAITASF